MSGGPRYLQQLADIARLEAEVERLISKEQRDVPLVTALGARIEELHAEVRRLTDVQMYDRNLIKALTADNERLTAERDELKAALEFYADPETYFALCMMADPPCGDFIRDFSVVEGAYTDRPMPGTRARAALEPKP